MATCPIGEALVPCQVGPREDAPRLDQIRKPIVNLEFRQVLHKDNIGRAPYTASDKSSRERTNDEGHGRDGAVE